MNKKYRSLNTGIWLDSEFKSIQSSEKQIAIIKRIIEGKSKRFAAYMGPEWYADDNGFPIADIPEISHQCPKRQQRDTPWNSTHFPGCVPKDKGWKSNG
ncbi:MAG: hypothetical protein ABIK28_17020 [Planctomycetota bacterium]